MSKLALTPSEVAVYSALAGPSKPQPSLYPRLEGINFEWCRNAGSAELAISPLWSGLIAVKTARPPAALPCDLFPSAPSEGANVSRSNSESVSLEGRRYFDANQFGEHLSSDHASFFHRSFFDGIHALPDGIGDLGEIKRHDSTISFDNRGDGRSLARLLRGGFFLLWHM